MRPLRPLLPDVQGRQREQRNDTPSRRRNISLACEVCRKRKTKCDGVRPTCTACTKHMSACRYSKTEARQIRQRYERLQQRGSIHQELIELIRDMPEQEAAGIFHRIRTGVEVETILSQARDGNLLLQLALQPETRRRYELPYISRMPSHLLLPNNPYLNAPLYRATLPQSIASRGGSDRVTEAQQFNDITNSQSSRAAGRQGTGSASNYQLVYSMPFHTAQLVEPLLEQITAAPWTQVISDSRLLRRLLSSYFMWPNTCGPFVLKDLFLSDMAAGRTRFCSSLLVNALLAVASQTLVEVPNRSKTWLPESLHYKFTVEARRLWDLELSRKIHITTIQAALLLSYNTAINNLDKIGTMYLEQSIEMGKNLNIFGSNGGIKGSKMRKARVFTAWAVFTWQTMFDFYYFRPPHLKQPPQDPLPDPAVESQWYAETWVRYPPHDLLVPLHVGHKLRAQASLHSIMHEVGLLSFGPPSQTTLTPELVNIFMGKLDQWVKALPQPLQPANLVFPQHFGVHIPYQQLVIAIAKLAHTLDMQDTSLPATVFAGKTYSTILREANIMLETVACLYYTRHSFENNDPWIAFALAIIGNTAVANLATKPSDASSLDEARSMLILSAQGLNNQGLNYHNGILMGMQLQSAIDPQDLHLVQTYVTTLCIGNDDMELIAQNLNIQWPLPIIGLNEDPEKFRLKNMIQAFNKIEIVPSDTSTEGGSPTPQ